MEQDQVAGSGRARQHVVALQNLGAHAQLTRRRRFAVPRLTSRTVLPSRVISVTRSGVNRVMPRVVTCCGVVRAFISTLASAAVFAAESQPFDVVRAVGLRDPHPARLRQARSKLPPRSMVSITTFDVEFSTPVNPSTFTPGMVCRHRLKTGAPSITLDSKRKPHTCARRLVAQSRIGVRDRALIRRHHVHAPRDRRANVPVAGSPVDGLSVVNSTRHLRACRVEKLLHRCCRRTELRSLA